MAFNAQSSSSFPSSSFHYAHASSSRAPQNENNNAPFDILEWYPAYQSCHRYFLDHAQHSGPVQALAAFINILLPFQKPTHPILSSTASSPRSENPHLRQPNPFANSHGAGQPLVQPTSISLIPYLRRLIATGHDTPAVLHGFFGDNWREGVGQLHEIERRNYLFAAKSTSWLKVKQAYDMADGESCPFLSPLKGATEKEIQMAESTWSEWLAMQDWMVGPRTPDGMNVRGERSVCIKREGND